MTPTISNTWTPANESFCRYQPRHAEPHASADSLVGFASSLAAELSAVRQRGAMVRHKYQVTEQRPLSAQEEALLRWLLANGMDGASSYLEQIPRARVVSRCSCGCPTLDLALDGRLSKRVGGSTILADVEGKSPEGHLIGVIVHAREGELSELEVYSLDGLAERFSLPTPELLELVQS